MTLFVTVMLILMKSFFQVSSFAGLAELEPGAPSVLKLKLKPSYKVSVYSVEICSRLKLNRVPPHKQVVPQRLKQLAKLTFANI